MLSPKWWKHYIKVDSMVPALLSSTVAYGFLLGDDLPGFWFVHALVLYPLMMFTLVGNHRTFLKFFPWNVAQIWFYKGLRLFHVVFFTSLTAAGNILKNGGSAQTTPATIAYFTTTVVLINQMFAGTAAKTREIWKREKARKQKERKEYEMQ
jgi:hypothetical protein